LKLRQLEQRLGVSLLGEGDFDADADADISFTDEIVTAPAATH